MRILAIDPGTIRSAYVVYEWSGCAVGSVLAHGIYSNDKILSVVATTHHDHMAIEMIASYGMAVGATVFETCVWIGRFIQKDACNWRQPHRDGAHTKVYRKDVKMHLCGSPRAKDANVRQAIIDMYPATGGGKTPQVGTKSKPGPLYGVSKDVWAALGVAITYRDSYEAITKG